MATQQKALITGITGQDGSYLAELLLEKGYEVHGTIRRKAVENFDNIKHIKDRLHLHYADLQDSLSIAAVLNKVKPTEIYNLAAQSQVRISFDIPEYTTDVNAGGPLRILEAMRILNLNARFYQASTSEMFGKVQETPQKETTPFYPRSPYGVAKLAAYWLTRNYREAYGMFTCNGILFNHESPRRGLEFVTQKVVKGLCDIKTLGPSGRMLELGNLDSKRDWGHAYDYVYGMWLMMQHQEPDDYILATGETHTVRDFIEKVAENLEMTIRWEGSGIEQVGWWIRGGGNETPIIKINPEFYRPTEVDILLGDPTKAKKILGWNRKYSFELLVSDMVSSYLSK